MDVNKMLFSFNDFTNSNRTMLRGSNNATLLNSNNEDDPNHATVAFMLAAIFLIMWCDFRIKSISNNIDDRISEELQNRMALLDESDRTAGPRVTA